MAEETSLKEYRRYFENLRGTEHAKNQLIHKLLERLEQIEEDYAAKLMDWNREVQYNRQGQIKERQMAQELKELQSEGDRDPFVLVLLDGDGMVFDEKLLERGETGGKEAANDLWSQTRDYIFTTQTDVPQHFKIMARTYANLKGLGEVCYRTGFIRQPAIVEDFARGFTGSKQLFDFVDVGSGKDRADEKITEILKLHLNNRSCRHVLFGGSHDNGYARLLEDIPYNYRAKITLLEGPPFERELRTLTPEFETVKFGTLFRSSKIVPPPLQPPIQRPSYSDKRGSESGESTQRSPLSEHMKPLPNGSASKSKTQHMSTASTPSPRASHATPATPSNGATTWAGKVVRASSPPPRTPPPAVLRTPTPAGIPRNKYGQRIDPSLTPPDPTERQRVAKIKMCNVHYLQRACPYGDACTHDHLHKPTKQELDILRYMNRVIPCRNGTACDEPKCMYGHRCQRSAEGAKSCSYGINCRFGPDLHGLDTRIVKTTVV